MIKKILLCWLCCLISSSSYAIKLPDFKNFFKIKKRVYPLRTDYISFENKVKRGFGLYQSLKSVNIENTLALTIINSLRDYVEFSKLQVGDDLKSTFDGAGNLVEFRYSQNPAEIHMVKWDYGTRTWQYEFIEKDTQWRPRLIQGELTPNSTLQNELYEVGLDNAVANEIIQVLLCKVNFRSYARIGDKFEVVLNERFYGNEIIETKVLFTSYSGVKTGTHKAYFYEDIEKQSTYTAHYTEDGQALINSGLRYPLRRLHVRSNYGWRRHPVTGRRAMHRGVDLRARTGEPVHAVASGKVILSGYNKYAGNKIGIRHRDKSTSYYYHLKRRSVRKGQWVRSHQVIGTVGATGRVTGPHLHFGFKTPKGRWMNPLNKRMIATPKLKGEHLQALQEQVAKIKELRLDLNVPKEAKLLLARVDLRNKNYEN